MHAPLHKYSLEMNETRFKTVKLLPQHKHQQAQAEGELISSRMSADHVSGRNYGALSHANTLYTNPMNCTTGQRCSIHEFIYFGAIGLKRFYSSMTAHRRRNEFRSSY